MISSTLYPPPSAFVNGRLSNRGSAILSSGLDPTSCNSLNLLELDELLGWAESAKSTPHQSAALDELDKLLGEFNIGSVDRLDKQLAQAKPFLNRASTFHTSESDIRNRVTEPSQITAGNRVFSEPRFEVCRDEPTVISEPFESFVQAGKRITVIGKHNSTMEQIINKEYPPEILHNFFGRKNLSDETSDVSSIGPRAPLTHTPSVCSSASRYSHSLSSSEKASNYTAFSLPNRASAYQHLPFGNPKFSTLLNHTAWQNDFNTLRGNGSVVRSGTLRSHTGTLRSGTGRSQGGTLRRDTNTLLKASRKKKRCKFLLCTPV